MATPGGLPAATGLTGPAAPQKKQASETCMQNWLQEKDSLLPQA
jgi:hypothetical protein